jgi:MFS family permease
VVGCAVSVSGIADVSYLTEVSPSHWRGALVSCNEACISLGFLVSYTVGYLMSSLLPTDLSWRVMFGISGIIALTQLIGMLFLPESPVWLQQQGRSAEAHLAIMCINDGMEPSAVDGKEYSVDSGVALEEIKEAEDSEENSRDLLALTTEGVSLPPPAPNAITQGSKTKNYRYITTTRMNYAVTALKLYYRQIIITVVLSSAQAFCGQGNILNYAPKLFTDAGVSADSTLLSTLLVGSVKFVSTVAVILSVDRIGRRILLLSGVSIICLSLIILIIAFSRETGVSTVLALTGTIGVVLGYSTSFGPLTWLITSEIFPSKIRGRALGAQAIVTGLCSYLVSYTMLSGMDRYGDTEPFILYLVASSLALLFSYVAIPDTGDLTPSEINNNLKDMLLWRKL